MGEATEQIDKTDKGLALRKLLRVIGLLVVGSIVSYVGIGCVHEYLWMRQEALSISCMENEKVLALALNQYAQDNDGFLPDGA